MIPLTASRLQLASHCLAPFRLLDAPEPPRSAAAARGTQIHAELAALEIERHGPTVHVEVSLGWRRNGEVALLGYDLGRDYPAGWTITGTADRIEVREHDLVVTDHKSGQMLNHGPGQSWQLRFLAMVAMRHFDRGEATLAYNYVDQQHGRVAEVFTAADAAAFELELQELLDRDAAPVLGSHCRECWCPAIGICPAIRGEAAAIVPVANLTGPLTRETAPRAYAAWRAAQALLDQVRGELERVADEHGGIPVGEKIWRAVPGSRESVSVRDVRAALGEDAEPLIKRSDFTSYRECKR